MAKAKTAGAKPEAPTAALEAQPETAAGEKPAERDWTGPQAGGRCYTDPELQAEHEAEEAKAASTRREEEVAKAREAEAERIKAAQAALNAGSTPESEET
ncbi:MAG: hypothetical protein MI755_16310 [Sphingomonadales bacterium]|nr:hypothetical protein [Sphingomonadales bacterium]